MTINQSPTSKPTVGRVVVTGIGAVTGWGVGAPVLWQGLVGTETAIRPVARFDATHHRTQLASEVPPSAGTPTDPRQPSLEFPRSSRLTLSDRFALLASREALAQASLQGDSFPGGVFFGSSTGGMHESEHFYARLNGFETGRPPLSWLSAQQYNGPGDAVARELKATGPVVTLSSACTSGTLSILDALDTIRSGSVELAVAGGSDSLCQLTHAGFNSLRAVDPQPSRPFRENRAGLTLGEGAAVLVLESLDHALRRGAKPLVEVLAGSSTCDAHHMTAPSPSGTGATLAIQRALAEAKLEPGDVDFVSAHGTGTPLNDAAEWQAISAVFGHSAETLPVTSLKGNIGHLLGAAGSVEAVATICCLREQIIHPTAGDGTIDPESPVALVREPLKVPNLQIGLSLNLAFGGSNTALLLRRWSSQ